MRAAKPLASLGPQVYSPAGGHARVAWIARAQPRTWGGLEAFQVLSYLGKMRGAGGAVRLRRPGRQEASRQEDRKRRRRVQATKTLAGRVYPT